MRLHTVPAQDATRSAHQFHQALTSRVAWELLEPLDESPWIRSFRARPLGDFSEASGEFVLKICREDLTVRERQIAQGLLLRETEVSRAVTHPKLASIVAVEREEGKLRLVQPFVPSQPLRRFGFTQPLSIKLWLARQMAEALLSLHEQGWLHGSLSPAAAVVAPNGHVTVNELGWARRLNSGECDLEGNPFMGDVRYAAPESLDKQGRLGAAADVYALGGVLGELMTGRRIWEGYEGPELVAAKRILSTSNIATPATPLPFGVVSLVNRMLNRDPLRRPSLSEVIQALVAYEIETFATPSLAKAA